MLKRVFLMLVSAFVLALVPVTVNAAGSNQIADLECQGWFLGYRAVVMGQRQYTPYNAMGDGWVSFKGSLVIDSWDYPMQYEGYTQLIPFPGFVQINRSRSLSIKVLDNTNRKMIIYEGRESLGPPNIYGEFVCSWS